MYITSKALPRRTVLRGLGATIGLPLLNSMVPAMTALARTAADPVRRFATVYVGNGAAVGYFTPEQEGAGYELTPILEPLAPMRDRSLVLTGIDNPPALALEGEPRGGHGRIPSAFMSGIHAKPTIGADYQSGITIDQIVANHLGDDTQLRSLELSMDSPEFGGTCDTGFACVYSNTLSWRGPTTPQPMQNNPRLVFERISKWNSSVPVLLLGDFNALAEQSEVYQTLVGPQRLVDTWLTAKERGPLYDTFHGYRGLLRTGRRIDWILARGSVQVESSRVITFQQQGQFPSDHFPVVADVQIGP